MKKYIAPEIDCVFFDITTPTNARTLEDWIELDALSQEDSMSLGVSTVTAEAVGDWAETEWQLVD